MERIPAFSPPSGGASRVDFDSFVDDWTKISGAPPGLLADPTSFHQALFVRAINQICEQRKWRQRMKAFRWLAFEDEKTGGEREAERRRHLLLLDRSKTARRPGLSSTLSIRSPRRSGIIQNGICPSREAHGEQGPHTGSGDSQDEPMSNREYLEPAGGADATATILATDRDTMRQAWRPSGKSRRSTDTASSLDQPLEGRLHLLVDSPDCNWSGSRRPGSSRTIV
jgi:hypothetical protein